MIEKSEFGKLPDGTSVNRYTIRNSAGEFVELLDFGAAIHSVNVKDKRGDIGNVVLGVKEANELAGRSKEGVTIGRCANRIAYGRYAIDGKVTQLETNAGGHFLHGASGNYAFKKFSGETDEANNSICFYLRDKGEGGFDCEVDVQVRFTFSDDHCLEIAYDLLPYGDTVLCPTNHAYFNLSGSGDVQDNDLKINSDSIAAKGNIGIPTGENINVEGLPVDFTSQRTIREAMESDTSGFFARKPAGYDDCFILSKKGFGEAAVLAASDSGRMMRVSTDMPALIVFTPPPKEAEKGMATVYRSICLETQFVPNAVNCPAYKSPVYRKGERFLSKTVYEFLVIPNYEHR